MNTPCSCTENAHRPPHDAKQVVGMLYVPDQQWENVYEIDCGFERGTIFADLDKPWLVGDHHE